MLCGRSHLHQAFWKELREHVRLDPEAYVNEKDLEFWEERIVWFEMKLVQNCILK